MKILEYFTSWFSLADIDDDLDEENVKGTTNISIIRVTSIDDAQHIVDSLTTSRNVVVNLQGVDKSLTNNTLDFLCGAQYALGGELININDGIYIACARETAIETNYL